MTSPSPAHTDREKLARRNIELSILNSIAQALNREVDLDRALHAALGKVADLLGLETGWIWLLEGEAESAHLAAAQNLPPALARHPHRMEGDCYCLDTFRAGDLSGAANVNVIRCSRLKWLEEDTHGLKYHASIPLYAQDHRLGVLNVASTDWRELSEEDLQLLYTVGDMLSIAIERARLFAQSLEIGALTERNRLAREIHDTLAQELSGIVLHLETVQALQEAGGEPGRIQHQIQEALSLARVSLEEARRSVLDLRAAPLEGRSLDDALQQLVSEASVRHGRPIRYQPGDGGRPLPAAIEIGLYRIAQEAVANALQHAGPSEISVALVEGKQEILLEIRDNGAGFELSQVPPGRFGLTGMNERAHLLGGQLTVESETGKGTRIAVRVPLGGQG